MQRSIHLTEDQLNFISSLKAASCFEPALKERCQNLLKGLFEDASITPAKSDSEKAYYHSPRKMIEFLSLFSRDDYFKWFTHKWDQDGLTLESLITQQKKKMEMLSSMLYNTENPINLQTYNQVRNFINFTPDPTKKYHWRDNKGQAQNIGWYDIVSLSQNQPDNAIEYLMLPDGHQFRDYIRLFKTSIEFRTDLGLDGRFNLFIKNSIKQFINGALSITFSDNFSKIGKDINIYCDISGVREALGIICEWIVKFKVNGANVKIDLLSNEEFYELNIFHEGSYFSNLKKLINPSGDLARLRNRLFSVCDLTMSGDFLTDGERKQCASVFLLENTTKRIGKEFEPCRIKYDDKLKEGVEYTLKFYKS